MENSCYLCTTAGQTGGSSASDAVIELVKCDTFEQMSRMASNGLVGGKKKKVPSKKLQPRRGRRMRGGECDNTSTSLLDSYTLGPLTVPSGIPAVNDGAIDYSTVQGSVLRALAATPADVSQTYNNVLIPSYLTDNNIKTVMQFGGMSSHACGTWCD